MVMEIKQLLDSVIIFILQKTSAGQCTSEKMVIPGEHFTHWTVNLISKGALNGSNLVRFGRVNSWFSSIIRIYVWTRENHDSLHTNPSHKHLWHGFQHARWWQTSFVSNFTCVVENCETHPTIPNQEPYFSIFVQPEWTECFILFNEIQLHREFLMIY